MIDLSQIANAPYTPMYAAEGYSKPKPGQRDEPFVHFFSQALTASQLLPSIPLQIDPDADFLWRAIMAVYSNTTVGFLKLRFQDAWFNGLSSDLLIQENIGGQTVPAPLYPEVFCPASSVVTAQIQEYTGGAATLFLALYGVKRLSCA